MKSYITKLPALIKITFALILSLGSLNLIGTNLLSTHGKTLQTLQSQTAAIQKDNLYLKTQIDNNSSLPVLATKAQSLGFVPVATTIALEAPTSVALVAN